MMAAARRSNSRRNLKAGLMSSDGFEIDRTITGRVKINVMSVANLAALLALLGAAVATWSGLNSRVDVMGVQVQNASAQLGSIRSDLNTSMLARDGEARELRGRVEQIGTRLSVVETVLNRMERKLDDRSAK